MRVCALLSVLLLSILLVTSFSALPAHAASTWNIQTLDKSAYDSGKIAIDSNNNPHIVYDEFIQGTFHQLSNVMYASWNGLDWNIQNVTQYDEAEVSSDNVFESYMIDFALDSNGNPHILFSSGAGLDYTYWTGSSWSTQTVDSEGRSGSMALDSADNPHIAYTANGNATYPIVLKYASWTGSSWNIQTLDASSIYSPSGSISLSLDSNNNPHIMYETTNYTAPSSGSATFDNIKYAVGNGTNWSIQTLFENVGIGNMVLDSNGNPHVVITEGSDDKTTSVYASWNGKSWINQTLPFNGNGCLTLDSHNNPHIDYINYAPDSFIGALMYANWTGNSWSIQTVDPRNADNAESLALDSNGNPHIVYEGQSPNQGQPAYYYYLNYATATEPAPTPTSNISAFSIGVILSVFIIVILATLVYVWKRKTQKSAKLDVVS